MPCFDHDLVDLIQNIRREPAYVIAECLARITSVHIQQPMTQYTAQGDVIVRDLLQFVVIPITDQANRSQHEYLPQIHTASAVIHLNIVGYKFPKNIENPAT
jgi:hypothetical protein